MKTNAPIGIFDSGLGGLSVLREIRKVLPYENIFFVADQGHMPYGPREMDEVREFLGRDCSFDDGAGDEDDFDCL